jgi:transposase-like protein
MNNKQTLNIIDALKNSIEKIGMQMTINNLNNYNSKSRDLVDYILNICCHEFGKDKSELNKSKQNYTYKKVYVLASYLLYNHASLTQQEIADILNKSKASVNRFIKEVTEYSDNIKEEKTMLLTLMALEKKVINQKKIIYNNG